MLWFITSKPEWIPNSERIPKRHLLNQQKSGILKAWGGGTGEVEI
jgi:hypothetical protein